MNRPVKNRLHDEPTVLKQPVMNRPVMKRPGIALPILASVIPVPSLFQQYRPIHSCTKTVIAIYSKVFASNFLCVTVKYLYNCVQFQSMKQKKIVKCQQHRQLEQ